MTQLRHYEHQLNELNVKVAVVTFDSGSMATSYVTETGLPWPLLVDKDRTLYRSYRMDRGGWWAIYGPASVWHYMKLLFHGRRLQKPGSDWRQLGGDVLIDPKGIVQLHFVSDSPHDRPTLDSILALIQQRGGDEAGQLARSFDQVLTDEAAAEALRAEVEGQFHAVWNAAVDSIITIDAVGIVQMANAATERVFGYPLDEVVGKNVDMLMPSPYAEQHDGYLANYLRTSKEKIIGIGREVIGKRKDGTTFPLHLAVSEVHVGGRRLFTGIIRDISDLKEAEKKLASMNRELEQRVRARTAELKAAQAELVKKEKLATLGQVSGGIAHEIRNPLNAVKTSAFYLLHAENPAREKVAEHLERIDRQVAMIDNVVTALSDIARLPEAQLEPHSVAELLGPVLKTTTLPESVETDLQIPDGLPNVMVDKNQIAIVFRNLVRNAGDAMPHGGTLKVSASYLGHRVTIAIADTGVGIPAHDLKRITEPLYSTKARGMGLGLAISTAILAKNHGTLDVTSEVGKGSRFRIEFEAAPH